MRIMKPAFAVLAASALVLSACSGSDDPGTGGGNGGGSTATDGSGDGNGEGGEGDGGTGLPGTDANIVDRADMKKGGNFTRSISSLPVNWNGMQVDGNTVDTSTITGPMSVINWIFADDASFEANPNFVESYDFDDAPEAVEGLTDAEGNEFEPAQVVTLKLNPEAKWNDGTPITVADYQATWDACNDSGEFQCASTDGWSQIGAIEQGENEFEVKAYYTVPYPDWSANFSGVSPAAGVGDAQTFNEGWIDPNNDAYWTGPYKIGNIDEGAKVITLVPNENWWGDEPMLDNMIFRAFDNAEATAQAFANGEIDYLGMITAAPMYELAQGRSDVEMKMSTSVQWRHFTFNSRTETLSNKAVRQAIQYGVDTVDITASDLAGLPSAEMDVHLGNHFFMPGQEGYQDNSTGFDPAKSAEILEGEGYEMGDDGFYAKDGKTLEVSFLRIPGTPASENEAAMFTDQMAEIGIKVNVNDVPSAEFFNRVIAGEYEVTAFAWNGTPYPMANVSQIYGKPFDDEGNLLNSNFAGLEVPEIDELIPQIASETDPAKRRELTNEVDQIIWDNVMVLPLYYRANITAVPASLANYGATAFATFLPENIGWVE